MNYFIIDQLASGAYFKRETKLFALIREIIWNFLIKIVVKARGLDASRTFDRGEA